MTPMKDKLVNHYLGREGPGLIDIAQYAEEVNADSDINVSE